MEEQEGNEGVATRQLASKARHTSTEGHTAGTLSFAIAPASPNASTASTPRPSIPDEHTCGQKMSTNEFFYPRARGIDRSLMVRGERRAARMWREGGS